MWLDALALGILGAFAAHGAWRGALASTVGLLTLGLAYAISLGFAPALAPQLAASAGVAPLVGLPLAGVLLFFGASMILGVAGRLLAVWEKRRRAGAARSALDRGLGAAVGALRGSLVVLLLGWLALWGNGLRSVGAHSALPAPGPSIVTRTTRSAVESGAQLFFADAGPAGRSLARAVASPEQTLTEVRDLLANPRVVTLRDDAFFWRHVEDGDVDSALARASFAGVAWNAELRRELAVLGLVGADAADDPAAFREAAAAALREVGPRLRALRADPELGRLIEDRGLAERLAAGDTLALLGDPRFQRLVARVASPTPAGP